MSVSVIVGGQYGSCGKGKTAVYLAQKHGCDMAIRSGGPNAGHSIFVNGTKYVTRQLPSVVAIPDIPIAIASGGMVNLRLLHQEEHELATLGMPIRNRLRIDPFAAIVEDSSCDVERTMGMSDSIGSTQTGTGKTQSDRIMRTARIARDIPSLTPFLEDVTYAANKLVDGGRRVIIEGTQGFGLSMLHGGCYPWSTSRDTSASAFASECGIAPSLVSEVWMVLRTWPIRVGGNSGPMHGETTWDQVQAHCGSPEPLTEMTSVTKKVRRVGVFDWSLINRACMVNRPTRLVVHGLDYLKWSDRGQTNWCKLSQRSRDFVLELEVRTKVKVGLLFTGPKQEDIIDLDEQRR